MTEGIKTELINNIKEWIKLDNEIVKMRKDMKEKNTKKNKLTETLVEIMKKNAIDCFDISGGSLVFKQTKIKQPINKKSLLSALQNYYKNEPEKADEIVEHVLNNRPEKVKETIRLKPN